MNDKPTKKPSRKLKIFLIISVVINVLFIGFEIARAYVINAGLLDYVEYQYLHQRMCEDDFQAKMDQIDKSYGPERAPGIKNSYAINVCLKNYKTGEQLDLQPLVDQVK